MNVVVVTRFLRTITPKPAGMIDLVLKTFEKKLIQGFTYL